MVLGGRDDASAKVLQHFKLEHVFSKFHSLVEIKNRGDIAD